MKPSSARSGACARAGRRARSLSASRSVDHRPSGRGRGLVAAGAGTGFAIWLRIGQPVQAPASESRRPARVSERRSACRTARSVMWGSRAPFDIPRPSAPSRAKWLSRARRTSTLCTMSSGHSSCRPGRWWRRIWARSSPSVTTRKTLVREWSFGEGRVAIGASAGAAEQVVAAGQMGRLARNGVPSVEAADTGQYFAWTDGRLVLEERAAA